MEQVLTDVGALFREVFVQAAPLGFLDPAVWLKALDKDGVFVAALVLLNLIVFTETGLLVGFLLPGDSLLVVVGVVASQAERAWNVPLLIGTLTVAAVLGDSVGYWIGQTAGPAVFRKPDGVFFRRSYVERARAFYEKHGGKTIIYARFVPIVRTFAPVVAGAARMEYRRFLAFNVVGGAAWIAGMILVGYYLVAVLEPPLKRVLGPQFSLAKRMDVVALGVVLLSVSPLVWKAGKAYLARRSAAAAAAEAATAVPAADPPG